MKEFFLGIKSPVPGGITVLLIILAWLSFLSVVISAIFS